MVDLKPTIDWKKDNYGVYCHLYNIFNKTKYEKKKNFKI